MLTKVTYLQKARRLSPARSLQRKQRGVHDFSVLVQDLLAQSDKQAL
jgi:hypothetical protein